MSSLRREAQDFTTMTNQSRQQSPGATAPQRSLMVDVVKGLAISLVAVGHTNQGMIRRAMWASSFGDRLNCFIYAFHMPAFFFVSGIFLRASLQKRGLRHFLENKVGTILYPFWFWALLLPLVPLVFGRYMASQAPQIREYLLNLLTGNLEWFLPALFVVTAVSALLYRVPLWLLFVLSFLLEHYWRGPASISSLRRADENLPFMVAGMWLGPRLQAVERVSPAGCLVLAAGCGVVLYWLTPFVVQPQYWRFCALGLLGTAMLLLVARAMGSGWLARTFAWIGVGSIAVFLLSAFGQGFGRSLLLAVHVRQPAAQLIVPSLLAILPAAWVYQHRVRLHVDWMFTWPWLKR